jgi:hypothetical protein
MISALLKAAAVSAASVMLVASCTPRQARSAKAIPDRKAEVTLPPQDGVDIAGAFPDDAIIDEEMRFADSLRRAEFDEENLEDSLARQAAEAAPAVGGKARIYLQRGFLDDAVAEMIRLNPFGYEGGEERKVFNVTDSTHRRLEFTLAKAIKRADGRKVTALDFVELWSRLLKSRPAQGLALFRNVQGAEGYVNGKEPLVNGFTAADEQTIRIRLAKPDPLAFHRMRTPVLIGGPFMLGAYFTAGAKDGETRLLPNANGVSDTAYLSECTVRLGGDPNALASFAQGKYSAMAVYSAADLETARTELEGKASLTRLPSDRYFIACKSADEQIRKFVHSKASGLDLLKNHVKAEGEEIFSVTAHSAAIDVPKVKTPPPQPPKPLKIFYRSDDPISAIIAEKLRADFGEAGIAADFGGSGAEPYEKALVSGKYDCAIGWAPEAVLENLTEQLHFASIWFNDEADSRVRLGEYREIPLFSVNNYMLLRDDVRLYGDRVSGMWKIGGR